MGDRIGIFFFIILPFHFLFGQSTISVQGVIRDAYSRAVIDQAKVIFTAADLSSVTGTTDHSGIFKLLNLIPGRYEVRVSAKSHQTQQIKDYLIGRTNVPLLFELAPVATDLPEIVIIERKNGVFIHPLSNASEVTREETERLPAGFFDPARLFTSQPGVSSMNDGANHLIIRGNNPAFVKWMIHGTEILNPNHLSNAGTFSDQASPSGGGVNMISASVLENTYLYKAPYPATTGNALAGALDLNLRKGSTEKLMTEAQISLLGMEVGIEGPLSNNGASFLARYRYSTVGLLSQFGVQFGDENINYQDVMVHVSFPNAKRDLSFFLFTGNNANDYAGKKDSTKRSIDKETSDIKFTGGQLITGMLHEYRLNDRQRIVTDIIYSQNKTSHRSVNLDLNTSDENQVNMDKLTIHSRWISLLERDKVWTTGVQFQSNREKLSLILNDNPSIGTFKISYPIIQPYTNLLIESGPVSVQGGLHGTATNKQFSVEPRAQFLYRLNASHSIQINLGKYGQAFSNIDKTYLLKSLQAQASFQTQNDKTLWHVQGYYQHHYDLPTRGNSSLLNDAPFPELTYTSTASKGNVVGMETELSGSLGTWRYSTNLALFHSTFYDNANTRYSGRFDQHYLFHASIGREWEKQKSNYKKIMGWYTAFQSGGAMRDTPIDLVNGMPVLRTNALYSISRPAINRLDMRIYRRRFYKNLNTLLALDLQNLTGQQNFAYSYYDYTRKTQTINYQLGILPNLSFTIEY